MPQVSDDSVLLSALKDFAEHRRWHLAYAKFNWQVHQSLLAHSFNVASLSLSLFDFFADHGFVNPSPKLRRQTLVTGFLHDAGKESETYQRAVRDFLDQKGTEPLDFGHQHSAEISPVLEALRETLKDKLAGIGDPEISWEEVAWSIKQLGRREDAGAVSESWERAPSGDAVICKEIVHLADLLMSIRRVEEVTSIRDTGALSKSLQFCYTKVATVRGILTQLLHSTLEEQFTAKGAKPILWFPNGTIFLLYKDASPLLLERSGLTVALAQKIRTELGKGHPAQRAKVAFGDLRAQVVKAPEFLFTSKEVAREFWRHVNRQRFAEPRFRKRNELGEKERQVFDMLSAKSGLTSEDSQLALFARFLADFNLLIVLYASKKELLETLPRNMRESTEERINAIIRWSLVERLELPEPSFKSWPKIAFQTKLEERIPVALTLWQSRYYPDQNMWRERLVQALEEATLKMGEIWREFAPDEYATVSHLLVEEVTNPLDPTAMLKEIRALTEETLKGKTGHGTIICQRCGGRAVLEAQAELFGKSEIYHDGLVAGLRVGGGNKIRVCKVCEFEEKIRALFVERGEQPIYILPQLALSRDQHREWQRLAEGIRYNEGEAPRILRLVDWAKKILQEGSFSLSPAGTYPPTEKEFANAIQHVAEEWGLDDLSIMIDPSLEAIDGKTVASLLGKGECKLTGIWRERVLAELSGAQPVYLTPNFILLIPARTVRVRQEPESCIEIRWFFMRCLLSRLFSATVLSSEEATKEHPMLGYTTVPSSAILKPIRDKVGTNREWVPTPKLDLTLSKLAALVLTAQELDRIEAGYGNSTLIRLLEEEPGRVLLRASREGHRAPSRDLISYLGAWNYIGEYD